MKFIKVMDEETARKLSKNLKLINKQNGVWTFLNDSKLFFDENIKQKITYSNILSV